VAATAAGLGAIAIGTDGGGSIRVPSAHTGVIGLKPTFGLVPTSPPAFVGVPPHVGPIARSVADLTLALRVLSLPDPRDPAQPARKFEPRDNEAVSTLRIAYSANLGYIDVDPEVASAFSEAIAALRGTGLQLEEAEVGFSSPATAQRRLFAARAAYTVRGLDAAQRARLDPAIVVAAEEGEKLSALEYLQAEADRVELVAALARFHTRFDLLLTPTSAYPAPLIDATSAARESFAAPFSLSRQPALSIPSGVTQAGLPIGLQIVGRHHEDARVLALAAHYERLRPFQVPPALEV
jgi:aspartyl-tRNA(Asn)/glutamyl-tRNA(Gln) amidotransferase subunit A